MKDTAAAVEFIRKETKGFRPEICMILGSGLGVLAEAAEDVQIIPFKKIPGFPVSTVKGHKGRLITGVLEGRPVIIMQGRVHYYEGYSMQDIGFPVRVMNRLGAKTMLVTNAAGACNPAFSPGDLMVITDHINFTFQNPLTGPNQEAFGPRFPDNSSTYDPGLVQKAHGAAAALGLELREGIYLINTGPSYETPAEVNVCRFLGADAVGMSTFPEALTANHCGMKVLGISMIGNMAAGLSPHALTHAEVSETAELVKDKFTALIKEIIKTL